MSEQRLRTVRVEQDLAVQHQLAHPRVHQPPVLATAEPDLLLGPQLRKLDVFSCLPIVIGGASQAGGLGGGLYRLLPGLDIGFAGAVYNAWILLIEILR